MIYSHGGGFIYESNTDVDIISATGVKHLGDKNTLLKQRILFIFDAKVI